MGVQISVLPAGTTPLDGTELVPMVKGGVTGKFPARILSGVVGIASATAQAGTIASTPIVTPPANGVYRVSWYLEITTAGSAGVVTATLTWTDDAQAETFTSGNLVMTAKGQLNGTLTLRALTTAAIAFSTTVTGNVGAQYAVHLTVERMT